MTIDDFGFWILDWKRKKFFGGASAFFPGEQGTSVQQPPVPDEGCAPIPAAAMARRFRLREMA
jgi:hypothetical protein